MVSLKKWSCKLKGKQGEMVDSLAVEHKLTALASTERRAAFRGAPAEPVVLSTAL